MRNRLFTFILLLALACLAPRPVSAVPAAPDLHELKQADDAPFKGRQWGDEFLAGWETDDGYTIVFDGELKSWTYADFDREGDLISSRRRVDRERPAPNLGKGLRPKGKMRAKRTLVDFPLGTAPAAALPEGLSPSSPLAEGAPPATVTRNIPVILVNFADTTPTTTAADFTTLLFSTGSWSLKDYYDEVSYGRFTVSSGPFGVTGWVAAANPHDYYGQKSGWGPPDMWPGDLAYEAVQQADAAVDFSAYDSNGDCKVDVVAIVHQGPGQEASGVATDIWSHSWSLTVTKGYGLSHYGPYTTNDLCTADPSRYMVVDNYIMQPETYVGAITTMGVFAHEYGHALGLIDLYDSDYTSEGVGNWSLMASGSWGGVSRNGDRPTHLDPWSKTVLSWVSPVKLTATETGKTLNAIETSGEVSQFLDRVPQGGAGEYFLLENRQKTGFDAALPGAGLLLWHIDESISSNKNELYPGCTTCPSHYKVALVQADNLYHMEMKQNRGGAGDPFPGSTGNRTINESTFPASVLYSSAAAGFSILNISDSGALMTADVVMPDTTPPVTTITVAPPPFSSSASGSFTFIADEIATFACRLDGGTFTPCTSPYGFAGLADGSHTFVVQATDLTGNFGLPATCTWTITSPPPCNIRVDGTCYATFAEAYAAIPVGGSSVMQLRQLEFTSDAVFDRNVNVTLAGGYDATFNTRTGTAIFKGSALITEGSVVMDLISFQ